MVQEDRHTRCIAPAFAEHPGPLPIHGNQHSGLHSDWNGFHRVFSGGESSSLSVLLRSVVIWIGLRIDPLDVL